MKLTKTKRKKIYQEVLKEILKGDHQGLCFAIGDKIYPKFYPWQETQENMPEFNCFVNTEDSPWSFGSTNSEVAQERRLLCIAMCIEMCN